MNGKDPREGDNVEVDAPARPHHCDESVFRILGMDGERCPHCGELLTMNGGDRSLKQAIAEYRKKTLSAIFMGQKPNESRRIWRG